MKKFERKALTESDGEFKRSSVRNRAPSLRQSLLASTCIFLTATTALSDTVVIDGQGFSGFLIDSTLGSTAAPLVIGGGSNASNLNRYEGGSKTLTTSGSGSTVFTNFSTKGGNGSGGGAGLGGVFFVDQGAEKALVSKGASLLPSGITEVSGHFDSGDAIEIVSQDKSLAKGLALYSAQELKMIKGEKSQRIRDILGYDNGEVVVHRDDLVLLK